MVEWLNGGVVDLMVLLSGANLSGRVGWAVGPSLPPPARTLATTGPHWPWALVRVTMINDLHETLLGPVPGA